MLQEDTFTICKLLLDHNLKFQNNSDFPTKETTSKNSNIVNLNTNSCYICNGYYGPSFEDSVCSICHAFLFPNTVPILEAPSIFKSSGDSDSGNDEPVENSQESMPNECLGFGAFLRRIPPVKVESLARELQRLSVITYELPHINIELFPPEVLMHMFQYLDEFSLWSVGQVCRRWRNILFMYMKSYRWKGFVNLRWPLLPIEYCNQNNYYELYSSMMLSSCCLKCVKQMASQELPSDWEENSWRRIRLRTEIKAMKNDPLDGIEAIPLDSYCCHWQAIIEGPAGSPYEGGLFFLYIQVPVTYPLHPPIVRFVTKIFHPNVSRHGDIGIDSIHHNWSLALTISKLLISIQSLLTDPFCDVCMEPNIGDMYLNDRRAFEEQARLWTVRYAMHDIFAQ